jgi:hypothetical protein
MQTDFNSSFYICPKRLNMLKILLPFCMVILLASCGGGKKNKLEKIKVQLVSEGPLFGGSNTATGKWKSELKEKVKSVRFSSARISCSDSVLSGQIGNLVLQMAAAETSMKKIAFYKGNASSGNLDLQMAEEQEGLEEFFRGQDITFVVDYDLLPEEYADNLKFTLEFDADLTTD